MAEQFHYPIIYLYWITVMKYQYSIIQIQIYLTFPFCIYLLYICMYVSHVPIYMYFSHYVLNLFTCHWTLLPCSQVLAVVNNVAVNMGVQITLQNSDFFSFRYVSRSGNARSYGSSIFNFLGTSILFPQWLHQFTIPLNSTRGFPFLHKMDKSMMKNSIHVYSLKVSPHKMLIRYEGQNSNFTGEKPGRHHINQMIRVKINSCGTN